jgi:hypothetical protein
MSLTVSTSLAISRNEPLNCGKVVDFLARAGIITDATSNVSLMGDRKEYGCRLVRGVHSKSEIEKQWVLLRDEYNLECAHLTVVGMYDGCVLNYLAPSRCKVK